MERGVHTTNIDEEADHGHALCGIAITKQLISEDLAGPATPRHGVDVQVGEALLGLVRLVAVGEFLSLVVEDSFEEIVLDVFSQKGLSVLLLETSNLANGIGAVPELRRESFTDSDAAFLLHQRLHTFPGTGADIYICAMDHNEQESNFNVIVGYRLMESRQPLCCAPSINVGSMFEKPAADLAISGTRSQEQWR
jgi:hypothetical protein